MVSQMSPFQTMQETPIKSMQKSIDHQSTYKSSAKRLYVMETPKVTERTVISPVKEVKAESPVKHQKKESSAKSKPRASPIKKFTSVFAKPNVLPMPVGDANPPPPFMLPREAPSPEKCLV
jgi:hypothetical protein